MAETEVKGEELTEGRKKSLQMQSDMMATIVHRELNAFLVKISEMGMLIGVEDSVIMGTIQQGLAFQVGAAEALILTRTLAQDKAEAWKLLIEAREAQIKNGAEKLNAKHSGTPCKQCGQIH